MTGRHHKLSHTNIWHNQKFLLFATVFTIKILFCVGSMDNLNVPCKFRESINITDGIEDSDGNVMYDTIVYSKQEYGTYDYEFVNESFRQPATPHRRGCICRKKTCVRLCCPKGERVNEGCKKEDGLDKLQIPVFYSEINESKDVDLFNTFGYTIGKPCVEITQLLPEDYPDDNWILYPVSMNEFHCFHKKLINICFLMFNVFFFFFLKTGVVNKSGELLTQNRYCINPKVNPNNTGELDAEVFICFEPAFNAKYTLLPIGKFK